MNATHLDRRAFLQSASTTAAALALGSGLKADEVKKPLGPSASAITAFYQSLTEPQRQAMCFDWDHKGYGGLPLRLHVTNNWGVSNRSVGSFTPAQRGLIEDIIKSVVNPGWPEKLAQQAQDDTGKHWTDDRRIAVFGKPGSGPCQVVISGFHLTLRAVADGEQRAAFGGAICHGHQPSGFFEKAGHPGNIFWHQAVLANKVYQVLDGKQQQKALITKGMPWYEFDGKIDRQVILPSSQLTKPLEPDVRFRSTQRPLPGLPLAEMSRDQQQAVEKVLLALIDPYRKEYQDQVLRCLKKQGGLEKCSLAFYQEHNLSQDGEWDNWRLEGPSFVWWFRGSPHVHIWIHVADDPATQVTSHFG